LKYEGQYSKDMRTGSWLFYTDKGNIREEGEFKILKAKNSDEAIGYNFVLNEELSYKHGNWKTYSEKDNKLSSEGSYNRSRQSGNWKYYYPGGKVVTYENSYNNNGQLNGVSKSYSRKGSLISEVNYKDGKKHGDVKTYDRKGNLIQHMVYKNGVKSKDIINRTSYKYKKIRKK
jgi:antitoxin component YwqK of YwqJK toxin-antitoxin module